jgi:hypothetical protein
MPGDPAAPGEGLRVTAVQNPLTSLADDVAATKRAIARQDGPVILVGHSSAGVVITEAGNDPKVAGLVYISGSRRTMASRRATRSKGYPATPGGGRAAPGRGGLPHDHAQGVDEDFVPDLPPASGARVRDAGRLARDLPRREGHDGRVEDEASWFIIPDDRMVPLQHERDAAARMKATVTTLRSATSRCSRGRGKSPPSSSTPLRRRERPPRPEPADILVAVAARDPLILRGGSRASAGTLWRECSVSGRHVEKTRRSELAVGAARARSPLLATITNGGT